MAKPSAQSRAAGKTSIELKDVVEKMAELIGMTTQLSPNVRSEILRDPAMLVGAVQPRKSSLKDHKKEVQVFKTSRNRERTPIQPEDLLSEKSLKRQVELHQAILRKLGIEDEVNELQAIKPEKQRTRTGKKTDRG
ncbi:hypothetical protein [Tautonia marina]|uniref:hypothetical protein n=1 Tax=Tautonia marina TaxID=2653855 RepID=UPI001375F249|nr:hypothetical protein [Tautonia marina]